MVIFAAAVPGAAGPVAGDSGAAAPAAAVGAVDSVGATKTSSFLFIYNVIKILLGVPARESSGQPKDVPGREPK
jgi:hypothetical protein